MKKHHTRWCSTLGTTSLLIKKGLLFSALFLSLCTVSCSKDNDEDEGNGGVPAPTYFKLGADNANMSCAGTIWTQYSDAPAGSEVDKMVDNNTATKHLTYHDRVYFNWVGETRIKVTTYSITSATGAPEADPKSWTLSGSDDNRKWVVLDSREDQNFSARKETKTYEVKNDTEYKYYKLNILGNHGAKFTHLAELKFSAPAFAGDIDDLMSKSSGSTHVDNHVMGSQHRESDLPVTAERLAWLKDSSKEPGTFAGLEWNYFVVGNLYPFGKPSPADVNQHSIGDCCLCAVMGCMAHMFPDFIKDIIKDNGDQTFTVKLYDPDGKQIEVGVTNFFVGDSKNIGACSGKNGRPTWATVLEKAIIKWFQAFRNTPDIGGIGTEYVAAIITGNGSSFAFRPGVLSASELQRAVTVSLKRDMMVVGGFSQGGVSINNQNKTVNGHAYSFYLPSDNTTLFVMRNPWGAVPRLDDSLDGSGDGLLFIKDDNKIPPLVDLRIMEPGAAAKFGSGVNLSPYTPPAFTPSPVRVAPHLLRSGK